MSAHPSSTHAHSEGEYEDLLSLWSDLESALSVLLSRPLQVQDFPGKVRQFDACCRTWWRTTSTRRCT